MEKYLYGAAVQGIQSFIFQTNELRDIVGASELVQEICTDFFKEFADNDPKGECIVSAAGNIKFLFSDRKYCEKAVLNFPKKVIEAAPGITISQAVVSYDEKVTTFQQAVDKLENKLHTQRNKPIPSQTLGLMAIERSRTTGLPASKIVDKEILDRGTYLKKEKYDTAIFGEEASNDEKKGLCHKAFGEKIPKSQFPHNIGDITGNNDWIAIIHADGNGLGQIIQKIGKNKDELKEFSRNLDTATKKAARQAFEVINTFYGIMDEREKRIPIRPVVLGGDDFTMICRADFAVRYTKAFLEAFEKQTESMKYPLTSCAGIAFIKSSFPFYYGYQLAEALCEAAKNDAKSEEMCKDGQPKSCLMFHKVQDSFVTNYNDIIDRELTPNENTSWGFGPYYLDEQENRWSIDYLEAQVNSLNSEEGNAVKSSIRKWLSANSDNEQYAQQLLNRARQIAKGKAKQSLDIATGNAREVTIGNNKLLAYPAYDILSLHSIIYQITK